MVDYIYAKVLQALEASKRYPSPPPPPLFFSLVLRWVGKSNGEVWVPSYIGITHIKGQEKYPFFIQKLFCVWTIIRMYLWTFVFDCSMETLTIRSRSFQENFKCSCTTCLRNHNININIWKRVMLIQIFGIHIKMHFILFIKRLIIQGITRRDKKIWLLWQFYFIFVFKFQVCNHIFTLIYF